MAFCLSNQNYNDDDDVDVDNDYDGKRLSFHYYYVKNSLNDNENSYLDGIPFGMWMEN